MVSEKVPETGTLTRYTFPGLVTPCYQEEKESEDPVVEPEVKKNEAEFGDNLS